MTEPESVLKEILPIGGMTCADCAAGIEKAAMRLRRFKLV